MNIKYSFLNIVKGGFNLFFLPFNTFSDLKFPFRDNVLISKTMDFIKFFKIVKVLIFFHVIAEKIGPLIKVDSDNLISVDYNTNDLHQLCKLYRRYSLMDLQYFFEDKGHKFNRKR